MSLFSKPKQPNVGDLGIAGFCGELWPCVKMEEGAIEILGGIRKFWVPVCNTSEDKLTLNNVYALVNVDKKKKPFGIVQGEDTVKSGKVKVMYLAPVSIFPSQWFENRRSPAGIENGPPVYPYKFFVSVTLFRSSNWREMLKGRAILLDAMTMLVGLGEEVDVQEVWSKGQFPQVGPIAARRLGTKKIIFAKGKKQEKEKKYVAGSGWRYPHLLCLPGRAQRIQKTKL